MHVYKYSWILTLNIFPNFLLLEEKNFALLATSWIFFCTSLFFNISETKHVKKFNNEYYDYLKILIVSQKENILPFSLRESLAIRWFKTELKASFHCCVSRSLNLKHITTQKYLPNVHYVWLFEKIKNSKQGALK